THVASGAEGQHAREVEARAQHLRELDGAALLHVVEVEVLVARAAVDARADDALARRRLPLVAMGPDRVLDLDADGALVDGAGVPRTRLGEIERLVDGAVAVEHEVNGEPTLEQHVEALARRGAAVPIKDEEVYALARRVAALGPSLPAVEGQAAGLVPGD